MQKASRLPGPALCIFTGISNTLLVYVCQVPGSRIAPLPSFSSWCSGMDPRISPSLHPSKSFPRPVSANGSVHSLSTHDSLLGPQSFTGCLITMQFSYGLPGIFSYFLITKTKTTNDNKPRSAVPWPCLLQAKGASLLHPVFITPVLPVLASVFITVTKIPGANNLRRKYFSGLPVHPDEEGVLELSSPGCLCQEAEKRGCLYSWTAPSAPYS